MRNILLFAALGAVVLTSCTKDEVVNQSANLAISFDSYLAKPTKGVPTGGTSFIEGSTMGVYAYNTKGATWTGSGIDAITTKPLINEKVTKGADGWTYANTAYYAKNENFSFLAYAPHKETVSVSDGKMGYVVSNELTEQVDLLVAKPVTDKMWDGEVVKPMDKIQFDFKHALSQVKFKAKLKENYEEYTVKVNSVTLKSIKGQGKLSLTSETVTWSEIDGNVNYIMNFTDNTLGNAQAEDLTAGDGHVFMLLPQDLKDVTFTFNITATPTGDGKTAKTRDYDVIVASGKWEASKVYVYTATLTMDFDAPAIEFGEPTISQWEAETNEDIDNEPTPAPGV